jgi:hypothetical protein
LHQNGDFIALSSVGERKKGEKKKRVHLEEHEIAGVFCGTVLQGDTSADSTFLGKASPTRELRGIHKRGKGDRGRSEERRADGRKLMST